MITSTVHKRLLISRLRPDGDDGSIAMAMLLTIAGMILSASLVPMALTQLHTTSHATARVHALDAAQAGLDAALGHIRTAKDDAGAGDIDQLPCGPLSGDVSVAGGPRYVVSIDYFTADPKGQPDSWIAANRIDCHGAAGASIMPTYALLRSQGYDGAASRPLRATYTLETTNQNIPGGLIHGMRTGSMPDLCMDAGSAFPTPGTPLKLEPCVSGSAAQTFAYNKNLTLGLVASKTTSAPLGACLDVAVVGAPVTFQPCGSTTLPRQQWSHTGGANFEGTDDGQNTNGNCFNIQNPGVVNSGVVLGDCWRNGFVPEYSWQVEASVGPGAAGPASMQIVNFYEFGRCIDRTIEADYLIAYPCHQNPNPNNIPGNQKWSWTPPSGATGVPGPMITSINGMCMISPGSTAAGTYVTTRNCPAGATPQNMTWTVYGDTGRYDTSYRIEDGYGNCLSMTDPNAVPGDFHGSAGYNISKIIVAPCSASTLQKWNAPPNILALPLRDFNEK